MPDSDKPFGGVHLGSRFGDGPSVAKSPSAVDVAFRLLIVGDFGGPADGRLVDVSGENLATLLASFGAAVELAAPNRLGSVPPALAIRLPIASVRDLDPRTIPARVPAIVEAQRLKDAFRDKPSSADFALLAGRPELDRVAAALGSAPAAAASAAAASTSAESDDAAVDRLLGMIDAPTPAAQPDVAKAAVSAFVSSLGKAQQPASASAAPQAVAQLLALQARDVSAHPGWLGVEAAWRSLQLILAARGSRAATRIELCEARRAAIADVMDDAAFAAAADGAQAKAILVLGAFGRSVKDLDDLDRIALAAERLAIPTIVSLDKDFFGAPPASVATMDHPAALLEGPGYAAWRGLRERDESQWLFASWNDFVLRSNASDAPELWGEPGVVVAAQILRSLARTGWPTEITGAETALGGLDVVEVEARPGRHSAIPLRAHIELGVARDLAREGVACLVCRADRDMAWLARAPSLRAHGAAPEADRKAMENFDSLPFRFVCAYFENLLRGAAARLTPIGAEPAAIAEALSRLTEDALIASGPGAAAHATPSARLPDDDENVRRFEVAIRLGQAVMGGFEFSLDLTL